WSSAGAIAAIDERLGKSIRACEHRELGFTITALEREVHQSRSGLPVLLLLHRYVTAGARFSPYGIDHRHMVADQPAQAADRTLIVDDPLLAAERSNACIRLRWRPALAPELELRQLAFSGRQIRDPRGGLDVHRVMPRPHLERDVDVFMHASDRRIEHAAFTQEGGANQHAVILGKIARDTLQLDAVGIDVGELVQLFEHLPVWHDGLDDLPAGHVDFRWAYSVAPKVQRRDDAGARLVRAGDEGLEPARFDQHVVVDEH